MNLGQQFIVKSITPRTDTLALMERHLTVAETRYWCNQYKTLSKNLERELTEARQRIEELEWERV